MSRLTKIAWKQWLLVLVCGGLFLSYAVPFASAASKENLRHRKKEKIRSFRQAHKTAGKAVLLGLGRRNRIKKFREIKSGKTGIVYRRYRQYFRDIPIWGEHVLITSKNDITRKTRGRIIKGIIRDIKDITPALDPAAALKLMKKKQESEFSPSEALTYKNEKDELIIYLDNAGKARLAYFVSFFADILQGGQPTRPNYIIDAKTGDILLQWEGLTHAEVGTGPGGNLKTGQYEYGTGYGYLDVEANGTTCTMNNPNVKTVNLNHGTTGLTAFSFACPRNTFKNINGAYSPLNDAHFFGGVVYDMYTDWYGVPPLTFQLMLRVHYGTNYGNAFWDGATMTFGDGDSLFYPLVGLDVIAHEVSHGFTEQNSDLIYWGQSGGVNESFSDIAGEAAEYYMYGSTDFESGAQIFKQPDAAYRYLHDPPLDGISIGHADDYYEGMGVHFSSGVFNKAFYLLATTGGWNPRKAFDVFVLANQSYWTPSSDFVDAGAGLIDAAEDLGYSSYDVWAALNQVGVILPNPARIDLDLPAEATEGGPDVSATVELSMVPAVDTSVILFSSNPGELLVPVSVTVLAGQSSTDFLITVVDDTELDGSQAVEIYAAAEGYSAANESILIHDNETATLTVDVPASATEDDGLLAGQGTLSVNSPVDRDVLVSLTVDDISEVTVPESVMVPTGQSSAAFDLTIIEDDEIDATQTATITASVIGWFSGSDSIDVIDNENLNLTVTIPATANEGDGVLVDAGTVFLSGTWATDLIIDLVSSDTSEAAVPATVTILAGETIALFDIAIIDDAIIDGDQTATVTASSAGWISGSSSVLVQDNDPGKLRFGSNTYTVSEAGGSVDIVVTRFPSSVGTLTVDYATGDGIAESGADYIPSSGTLTFDAGTNEQVFTVQILEDTLAEESETVKLTLSNPTGGGTLEDTGTAILIITDNEEVEISLPKELYDGDDYRWDIQIDGRILDGSNDAYDGGHDHNGFAHFTEGLLVGGREVIIGPAAISGLEVTRRIYVPNQFGYARFLEVIHNPGPTPIEITVPIRTNLGSDYDTIIVKTSSGDKEFTVDDNWIVTDDNDDSEDPTIVIDQTPGDPDDSDSPVVNHVIANDHGSIRPSDVSVPTGMVYYNYDLSLGPGDTKIIMHFGVQSSNRATALAMADQLMGLELGALAGLSKTEISRIANFKVPKLILVELPEYVTEGDGDLPELGSVSVPKTPTRDLIVALSSSSPADLTVPATVMIPAGQTRAAFDLTVLDDALLDGATIVTVTGTASDYYSGSSTLKVHDNEIATLTVDLPASATEDGGVLAGQGSVTVSSLVDSSVLVDLNSSSEDVVRVPAAVWITAGQSSAIFDLEIIDDGIIDGNQAVTITATVGGWTAGRSTIEIRDNEEKVLTTIFPEKAFEWQGLLNGQGIVQIQGTYPIDLVVALSSDDTSEVVVADTVTIPAGQTAANFDLTIIDDDVLDHDQNVTITASSPGWTSGSDTIVVAEGYRKGSEFRVNTYTARDQQSASIAGLENGGFIVTWQSYGQDGDQYGIFGQIFDSTGAKVGSEFTVNTYTSNSQYYPSASGLKGGGFVVVWQSTYQDGSSNGVFGQVFDSAGTKEGGEFQVNTFTQDYQSLPSAARLEHGGFVVTWLSNRQDGDSEGIFGQIFDNTGAKLGDEFPVNTYTKHWQSAPAVTGLEGGGFVVTWQSFGQDGSWEGVYGQIFDYTGAKTGSEFQINTFNRYDQSYPSVAGLEGGGFVVTWQSYGQNGSDGGIYGQIFNSNGAKAGGEFPVNTYIGHDQTYPSVAGIEGGGFVVTWESYGQDGSSDGIFGQVFDRNGTIVGSEFQINTYTSNQQSHPVVTGLQNGEFAVTWDSYRQDGSAEGIYGQMFVTDFVVISMPANVTEGDGVLSGLGSVALARPPFNDLVIRLTSSHPSKMNVPDTVTIPAGQTSQLFDLTIGDDDLLNGPQTVIVSGTADDYPAGLTSVTIHDNETAVLRVSIPETVTEGDGVLVGQGMVAVNAAVDSDIVIELRSSDVTEVRMYPVVTVPAGHTTAAFDLIIVDDIRIDGTRTTSITAALAGWTSGSDTISISDNDAFLTLDVPALAKEGEGELINAGRISIIDALEADLIVELTSNDTSEVTVPTTVTIPAGETSVSFGVTIMDEPEIDGIQTATITGTAADFTADTDNIAVIDNDSENQMQAWPTYQGHPSHSGYVPVSLHPHGFVEHWIKPLSIRALNPVAAAEGRVFVSPRSYYKYKQLFVLNAASGEIIWQIDFGDTHSVNPPAYDKCVVYVQTGNHMADSYLRAYDVTTGNLVFQSNFDAQWGRYYAPTIYNSNVYVNGGQYGGAYAFNGLTGEQLWFAQLNQNDEWTPAVNEEFVFAYTGRDYAELTVIKRQTGASAFAIPDNNFDYSWGGMNLAPVLGSDNNVIVIQGGRLISFDLDRRAVGWEINENFAGQPSLASGRIYAISDGALSVRSESDGSRLWSWSPPDGSLSGTMIATDSHILAGTDDATYAIDLNTQTQAWNYPAGGKLALSEGILYIATDSGTLVAIDTGIDSDSDGIPDHIEETTCTDPYDADTDNDGISDGVEDADQNGVVDPGEIDPCNEDTDSDDLPDGWEVDNGLDPLDSTGVNGRNRDLDADGWTNYEEYLQGSDPDNHNDPLPSPPVIIETIPHQGAGIDPDTTRVANTASFAVYIEDADGIDVTDPASIAFSIDDGQAVYRVDLDNTLEICLWVLKLDPNEDDTAVTRLWAVYHRAEDDARANSYLFDSHINVLVNVKDRRQDWMATAGFDFRIETEIEHDNAEDNSPEYVRFSSQETDYDAGIEITGGDLAGARIYYNSSEPMQPILGPLNELPAVDLTDVDAVGVPMNLQPPAVFSTPVKLIIPVPGQTDVGNLSIYFYNGMDWVMACDAAGNVTDGGDGWMVPGSRVNHNDEFPATIEIQVYHFSAVQAGTSVSNSGGIVESSSAGGGGCFIATAAQTSPFETLVRWLHQFCDRFLPGSPTGTKGTAAASGL